MVRVCVCVHAHTPENVCACVKMHAHACMYMCSGCAHVSVSVWGLCELMYILKVTALTKC